MSTQTKGQHTPGPWSIEWPEPESALAMVEGPIVLGDNGDPVAEVLSHDDGFRDRVTPDARLIAAAPDLLAALERTYRLLMGWAPTVAFKSEIQDHLPYGMDEAAKAFLLDREIPAAIAKARGEG